MILASRSPAPGAPDGHPGAAIADALRRTVHGPVWHGPALHELVDGLTPEEAIEEPIEGAHSIWTLALHVAAWADIARQRLDGRTEPVTMDENFPMPGQPTAVRWRRTVAAIGEAYDALAAAAEGLDATALAALVPGRDHTVEHMLRGVVEHGAYHGGQVALLRRALGIVPPAS